MLETYTRIYTLADEPAAPRLRQLAPLRSIGNAAPAIAKLRMNKSAEEIALIQRATDVTLDAHRTAWQHATAGLYEYQIAAAMSGVYMADAQKREKTLWRFMVVLGWGVCVFC